MSFAENLPRRLTKRGSAQLYPLYLKRGLDLLLALLLVPACALVVAFLVLAIRRDGGPAFFGHVRVGQGGRLFRCWKLRTMVPDAQEVFRAHLAENPEAALEWARDVKLRDDPRITSLGRVLRATSLDELPQLWNVLVGDMSLVGPRPVTETELERYAGHEHCYLWLRPGVTGLWQVSGRNGIGYDERVRLDAQYFTTCSLRQDISILLRTFGAVIKRTGQ